MRAIRGWLWRLRNSFGRQRQDNELAAELESHLQFHIDDNLRTGMSAGEARRQAMIKLGGVEQAKETYRDRRGLPWLDSLVQDIRFGLRMLRKNPGFTLVAVLTIALGIGANTAIFSLVNAVMLRLLPVQDPQQLMLFTWQAGNRWPPNFAQTGIDEKYSFSYPQFAEFRDGNGVLSDIFAFVPLGFSTEDIAVNRNGEATSANGMMVTGGYFSGLGVTALLGRTIAEQDEQPGAPRVAVISYAYWNGRFGRDPKTVGANVAINGIPFTIVGVAPQAFFGETIGGRPDYWIAFDDAPNLRPWSAKPPGTDSVYSARDWICLNIMGRLKPGVSRRQAEASLGVLYRRIVSEDWTTARPEELPSLSLTPSAEGTPYLRELLARPLFLLMGTVGIVLLMACANVATLLLARASARSKEIGVRLAMGASRWRLIRQLLTESIILSLAGGAVGFLLAEWGTPALLALPSHGQYALIVDVRPDIQVLLFTLIAAVFTGILFGLAPAFGACKMDLSGALKDSRALFLRDRTHRLGELLVVAQISACLVLMICSGLFLRSLNNLTRNNFGFNQTNLLTFGLDPTHDGYGGQRLVTFYSQLLRRIQSLPGVQAATLMEFPLFGQVSSNTQATIAGDSHMPDDRNVRWQTVGPDFFRTMQIPILFGRGIEASDDASGPNVAVIDQTFAARFFPNGNPLGHHFGFGINPKTAREFEIVGVARPAELTNVHAAPRAKAYLSYQQRPELLNAMYFEIRSEGNPEGFVSEIREAVRQSDPNLPLLSLEKQSEIRNDALTGDRIMSRFSTLFGALALMVAIIGLYGIIAYAVSRKAQEIGVRMALGASPADVLRLVIGQGLRLAGIGIVIGLVASACATRLIGSLIFGVTPTDPVTFVGLSVLLLLVALAACYIPARRAMRVDPMVAIRHE